MQDQHIGLRAARRGKGVGCGHGAFGMTEYAGALD